MRVVVFCHSLVSDWNHGNAHFLRGIVSELQDRGHDVTVYEPRGGWSRANLERLEGERAIRAFAERFPDLVSHQYEPERLDLERALDHADLVLVHEWNDPELVKRIGTHRGAGGRYTLLFHDTHHRAATAPDELARFDLAGYDGVLAFGEVIRQIYVDRGWASRAFTWHEAADTRVFAPHPPAADPADLVWVGNWGDDERTAELHEFLLHPARRLALRGAIHGVRYPRRARWRIWRSGLRYRGWIANHRVPEVFARHRLTVHVPRGPYVRALPGIPTIRVFEALACAIPLVCSPWDDVEGLFTPGEDFLSARDGREMTTAIHALLADPQAAAEMARHGRATVLRRHTCAARVDELLSIHERLAPVGASSMPR
ncbi:MAG: glycosyltransferase [Solirubrobacterales bacterium]|nr:glycosyltransferase [Solirubrobacterales bacterium]